MKTLKRSSGFDKTSKSGTTLIEVMLAAFILAVLAVTVAAALYYPRWLVVSHAHKQEAIHAATDALEQALSGGYSSLPNGLANLPGFSSRYIMNGRYGSGTLRVETLGGLPEYKRVTVTVNYPGGTIPVVLETLITPAH